MNVSGLEFLLLLPLAVAVFHLLPGPRSRAGYLAALNLAFLLGWVRSPAGLAALGLFLAVGFAAALLLIRRPSRIIFWTAVSGMVLAFLVLYRYEFLTPFLPRALASHALAVTGLSYMLFRQIHFLVAAMHGRIPAPTPWTYLNYQLNLLTLLAGPIQRYNDFRAYWQGPGSTEPTGHEARMLWLRILAGYLKVAVIGAYFLFLHERSFNVLASPDLVVTKARILKHFLAIFYSYPIYVYCNFSGYCDIMIGAAGLIGLRLPENFDRPYLARNMIDFWGRWHMTLSRFLRDYLFNPLLMALTRRAPAHGNLWAVTCYFVVFCVAGVWHGSTYNFVVFGLLHGLGVSAAKLWENRIISARGRKGHAEYLKSRPIRLVSTVVTLHFVAAAFLVFPRPLDQCLIPVRLLAKLF